MTNWILGVKGLSFLSPGSILLSFQQKEIVAGMCKVRRNVKSLNGRKRLGIRGISMLLCHYPSLVMDG